MSFKTEYARGTAVHPASIDQLFTRTLHTTAIFISISALLVARVPIYTVNTSKHRPRRLRRRRPFRHHVASLSFDVSYSFEHAMVVRGSCPQFFFSVNVRLFVSLSSHFKIDTVTADPGRYFIGRVRERDRDKENNRGSERRTTRENQITKNRTNVRSALYILIVQWYVYVLYNNLLTYC